MSFRVTVILYFLKILSCSRNYCVTNTWASRPNWKSEQSFQKTQFQFSSDWTELISHAIIGFQIFLVTNHDISLTYLANPFYSNLALFTEARGQLKAVG